MSETKACPFCKSKMVDLKVEGFYIKDVPSIAFKCPGCRFVALFQKV